ncbi:MAG: response regulator, partial [Cloacibacillus porcorum]|nr:response regulator [Cloacibacillus porcorum]
MKVVVVDDEELLLDDIIEQLKEMPEIVSTVGFTDPEKALEYILHNEVHVAFLDINMFGMDGMTLAAHVQREKPSVSIIFLTGYSAVEVEAFALRASGYIMKPVSKEDILT